jgi:hypothetical protein
LGAFGAPKPKSERTGGTAIKKVSGPEVVTPAEALESPIPLQIQEALGLPYGPEVELLLQVRGVWKRKLMDRDP